MAVIPIAKCSMSFKETIFDPQLNLQHLSLAVTGDHHRQISTELGNSNSLLNLTYAIRGRLYHRRDGNFKNGKSYGEINE